MGIQKKEEVGKSFFQTPIGISLCSNLIFAIIVGLTLAYIQHGNWKEQEKISRHNRRTDLIFEKRAEILEKYANVYMMRTQNIWNIRNVRETLERVHDKSEFARINDHLANFGRLEQELIARMVGVETLEACYFRTSDLPSTLKKLRNILHDIIFNFTNEHMSPEQLRKNRSIDVVQAQMNKCEELNNIIVSRMLYIIYEQ